MDALTQTCRFIPIPSPPGLQGPPGTSATNGGNAWGTLQAAFTMPAQGGAALAVLDHVDFLALNEPVWVEGIGTLQVTAIAPLINTLTLLNPQTATAYAYNAPPGAIAASGLRVLPTGFQGPAGVVAGAVGGDLTGNLPNPLLKSVGAPGIYGDSTHVAQITTDNAGRVTAVSLIAIAFPAGGGPPSGPAGGDLAGTYPNPSLAPFGPGAALYGGGTQFLSLTLDAKGRVAGIATRLGPSVATKTSAYSATTTDDILLADATTGAFAIGFPLSTTCAGKVLVVKKIDSSGNAVTVQAGVGDSIDGASAKSLPSQWNSVRAVSSGSAWFIV